MDLKKIIAKQQTLVMLYCSSILMFIMARLLRFFFISPGIGLFFLGAIFFIVFAIICIREIYLSRHKSTTEQLLWVLALVFFSYIAGFVFLLQRRANVK